MLALRERLGITQADLAAILGYREETICRFEGGRRPISRIVALACLALESMATQIAVDPERWPK